MLDLVNNQVPPESDTHLIASFGGQIMKDGTTYEFPLSEVIELAKGLLKLAGVERWQQFDQVVQDFMARVTQK